ncbi:putative phosphohydrolase, Icc family [Paenibacillus pasadenensis]|uniref:Putative phosphohydrolase, Icc family n=1 Tax=Paenibacillus pasadenensis TaxID=217090 RepID=A0A2N5NCC9_9BACL|nr:metallophosphoesterase [Paenibacillus pasadenensis]PLT48009.1 putative phosphohydrolase, Icc family [Paenibacillus pasadenensis]
MPIEAGRNRTEGLLLQFQVITDTHVKADPLHPYNRNLARALEDIAREAPDSDGIMHAGDITDRGQEAEYAEFNRIWREHGAGLPASCWASGNHDVGLGHWPSRLGAYLDATGMSGPYHDHWVKGYHFIFLGTEQELELFSFLSETQLSWLDAKLSEGGDPARPAFVFLHQPLKDTVAGSYEAQRWYGVVQDEALKEVLSKHRNAVLFTGHTHWELEASHTLFDASDSLPRMLNAASVAYLWTDEDEHKDGSQGLYIEVYADRVVVRGRDFAAGEWLDKVRFEWSIAEH